VHAEYAVRLLLDEELDLALGVQVRLGARVGEEGEPADLIPHALLLQVLLRLPDPRYLRVRVHHARDRVVVHVPVPRVDVLSHRDPLLFRLVREHRPERDIAYALDIRHGRVELVVDHDAPTRVDFDTDIFKTEALDVWSAADGYEHNVRFDLRALFSKLTIRD